MGCLRVSLVTRLRGRLCCACGQASCWEGGDRLRVSFLTMSGVEGFSVQWQMNSPVLVEGEAEAPHRTLSCFVGRVWSSGGVCAPCADSAAELGLDEPVLAFRHHACACKPVLCNDSDPVMLWCKHWGGGSKMTLAMLTADMLCRYKDLKRYIDNAVEVDPDRPVLVDKYLDRADELDVDALCDKDGNVVIAGIMQHIEQAGVHSGDQTSLHAGCVPVLQTAAPWQTSGSFGSFCGHLGATKQHKLRLALVFCQSAQTPVRWDLDWLVGPSRWQAGHSLVQSAVTDGCRASLMHADMPSNLPASPA